LKKFFPSAQNFYSLSVKDLLEARETYHVHLSNKENVVATAIGRFRIRNEDPDSEDPTTRRHRNDAPPRTLENTVVKPWSWPCLLVFVKEWLTQEQLKDTPEQVVPPFVYMSDGRVVPLCVIYAPRKESISPKLTNLTFPSHLVGGGYPAITTVQGQQHVGTIGCLVTDGDSVYALTNKHVTGDVPANETRREIYTFTNGKRCKIGITDNKQLGKCYFSEVYEDWPGKHTYINLDAGLIKLDDLNDWTAQVFGLGEIDEIIDLNIHTISLDLIGCPVKAFGGASGQMIGEIQALFYRYKSMGGFDYVSDFLIGSIRKEIPLVTHPGDSGTVWFYDPRLLNLKEKHNDTASEKTKRRVKPNPENKLDTRDESGIAQRIDVERGLRSTILRPIALQWGGHILLEGSKQTELDFALATCMSTICRELDVDLVRNLNTGHSEYWGKLAHYKIAAKACDLLSNTKLSKLMQANLSAIAFNDDSISRGDLERIDSQSFVPLADVADIVWRITRKKDEANHFSDMDQEGKNSFESKTLFDLVDQDKDNIDINIWNNFYDSLGIDPANRGSLPFRVWQIYNEMVKFVSSGDIEKFVCAAGIISHYVGDASQPLHVSKYHHGHPDIPAEKPVHAEYETKMIERFAADIIEGVNSELDNKKAHPDITEGINAATSIIELMKKCVNTLPSLDIVDAFNEVPGHNRLENMFNKLSSRTIHCVADGSLYLAMLWESAWKEGNGDSIPINKLIQCDLSSLKNLYENKSFLEAFRLTDQGYADVLR